LINLPLRSHYRLTVDKKQNFILPKLPSATSFIREPLDEIVVQRYKNE